MDSMKSAWGMTMIADQIGDAMDRLIDRANAALPRVTGLVGKPEPASRLGSPSDHPISQEQENDRGD